MSIEIPQYSYEKITFISDLFSQPLDITKTFKSISLTEDIDLHYISGSLEFTDASRSGEYLESNGNEKVIIELKNNDKDNPTKHKFEFKVYNLTKDYNNNSSEITIILDIIDEDYIYFLNEYSTSINKDTLVSKWMKDFSSEILKKEIIDLEETAKFKPKRAFSFPYQKFHSIFSYLNQYVKSKNKGYYYKYYSRLVDYEEKKACYVSLMYLLNKAPAFNLIQTSIVSSKPFDISFQEYKLNPIDNIYDLIINKSFGGKNRYFDYATKDIKENEIKYTDTYKEIKYRNNRKNYVTKWSQTFDTYNLTNNQLMFDDNLKTQIASIYNQIFKASRNISVTVKGYLGRSCGELCTMKFLKKGEDPENAVVHLLDGVYLIKSITHNFFPGTFKQQLNLVSFTAPFNINNKQLTI